MTHALEVISKLIDAGIGFSVLSGEGIANIVVKDSVNNNQLRVLTDVGAHMSPDGVFNILAKTI